MIVLTLETPKDEESKGSDDKSFLKIGQVVNTLAD